MHRKDIMLALCFAGAGCALLLVMFLPVGSGGMWGAQSAAAFFTQSITVEQIQNNYHNANIGGAVVAASPAPPQPAQKVRVLIVPGHQPRDGGTEFNGVYERDVVVDIANALARLLGQNTHYVVMVARSKTAWNPLLQSYFDTRAGNIVAFQKSQSLQMARHLADGKILPADEKVYHNTAPDLAVFQLYGINKWASDEKYDITLHLHVNDDAKRRLRREGEYGGFSIYVPDRQYSNAKASRAIAESIAVRLNAYHATSTLPKEDVGVVEDQELIAIGSNNSVDGAALLIEYGYIYEPQFQEASVLPTVVADYAYQTYLGLQDFFHDPVYPTYGSISLPYDFANVTAKKDESGAGVYALQVALRHLGYYPPVGKTFAECPVAGVVGACTQSALKAYQSAHDLEATGLLGPKTRSVLSAEIAASRATMPALIK